MDNLRIIYGSGWWYTYTYPPEKYEFVNWDDEITYGKIRNVPNHQPDYIPHRIMATIIE